MNNRAFFYAISMCYSVSTIAGDVSEPIMSENEDLSQERLVAAEVDSVPIERKEHSDLPTINFDKGLTLGVMAGWDWGSSICGSDTMQCDDDNFVHSLSVGWQWNHEFKIEAEYLYFWPKNSNSGNSQNGNTIYDYGSIQGVATSITYHDKLSQHWGYMLKGGAYFWENKFTGNFTNETVSSSTTGISPLLGIGLTYDFEPNWRAHMEYRYIDAVGGVKSDANIVGLGITYRFGNQSEVIKELESSIAYPRQTNIYHYYAPEQKETKPAVVKTNKTEIFFDFDSSELSDFDKQRLANFVDTIADSSDEEILLIGHTDSSGNMVYNEKLSHRRAREIKDYLIESSVPEGLITILALGQSQPKYAENMPEKNRRVDVILHSK
ncbi:OmpA family protein [Vibrio cholerae]